MGRHASSIGRRVCLLVFVLLCAQRVRAPCAGWCQPRANRHNCDAVITGGSLAIQGKIHNLTACYRACLSNSECIGFTYNRPFLADVRDPLSIAESHGAKSWWGR